MTAKLYIIVKGSVPVIHTSCIILYDHFFLISTHIIEQLIGANLQ